MRLLVLMTIICLSLFSTSVIVAAEEVVVARIGESKITATEFDQWLSYSLQPGQTLSDIDNKQKASMLHQIVTGMVISEIARKEKFDQRPDIRKRLELAENNFLTLHYLNEVVAASVEVNDDDIRAYYTANTGEFKGHKGQPLPLEEVQERIATKLAREPRRDAVDAFVKDAMQKANAEVDVQSLLGGDPHFQ
jgi:hypothetical protein